jgi:predicted helicase
MWNTLLSFSQMNEELAREAFQLDKDARDWKVALAQQDVRREGGPHRQYITPILYRPFDKCYTYYTGRARGFHCRPRSPVMRYLLAGENLALITNRQVATSVFQHALVTDGPVDLHILETAHASAYIFPLYLHLPEPLELAQKGRQTNLAVGFLERIGEAYGFSPTPEEVLGYIYAVLYSPTYWRRYAEALRVNFPRVPFTADAGLFRQMAALGQELIALHLLRSPKLAPSVAKYQGLGGHNQS